MATCSLDYFQNSIIDELDSQLKKLRCSFVNLRKVLNELNMELLTDCSQYNCNRSIKVTEQMFKIMFLMQKKVSVILHECYEQKTKIQHKLISKTKKFTRKVRKKRFKSPIIFVSNELFKEANGEQSFYFRFNNDSYYRQNNSDYVDIINSGYQFQSCMRTPVAWKQSDTGKFINGIRQSLMQEKSDELMITLHKFNELVLLHSDESNLISLQNKSSYLNNYLLSFESSDLADLLKLESDNREFNWTLISNKYLNKQHSAEECQAMWHLVAKPSISKEPWTDEEDMLLHRIVIENKFQNWHKVNVQLLSNRSEFLCFVRFKRQSRIAPHKIEKVWTVEDNRKIEEIITKHSSTDFTAEICTQFQNASKKQIYHHVRYMNSIRLKKKGFFNKREKCLINLYASKGHSYSSIAQILGNRTPKQIKDYHRALIEKRNHGRWKAIEIRDLLMSVKYIGIGQWRKISKCVNGRSPAQCREKFLFLQRKKKDFVDHFIENALPSTKITLNQIRVLLKRRKQIEKANKKYRSKIDQKIELYFLKHLEIEATNEVADKNLFVRHIFSLFRFLGFDVNVDDKFSEKICDWLVEGDVNSDEENEFDELFTNLFSFNVDQNNAMRLKKNAIFSPLVCKISNLLPPNKCSMYGFDAFMKNYESFAKINNVDFHQMWKQIDFAQKRNKEYVEAKIMWYRILKAIFYWPIKLKQVLPEKLLKP